MIPESFLLDLKYHCDVESIIGGYVPLKRRGRNLTGLCPFHSEKTASFTVYPESQSFYCFGCGAGGDIVTFIRKAENLDYVEAVRHLADKAGLTLPEDSLDDTMQKRKTRILEINRKTARFYYDQLMGPGGEASRAYLTGRGLTKKTVTNFGVGFAPEGWDHLRDHLLGAGFSQQELLEAGVVTAGRNGGCYDTFRDRIIFPIIDLRGMVIAFGGRALGDRGPKYLNSGDTAVFKKSRNLFALNVAKASKRTQIILAEGYMDVIALHQGGFDNAVATLGTALTPEQARLIAQYGNEVVIAYDADNAGQTATRRAINLFEETGVKVKVLSLTGAKDPDEFIRSFGAVRFQMLLDGSSGAVEFEIGKLKGKHLADGGDTAEAITAYLKAFAALMADIHNPIEREVYIAKTARELGVEKQAIDAQVQALRRRKDKSREKQQQRDLAAYTDKEGEPDRERRQHIQYAVAEEQLILLLWKNPDMVHSVVNRIRPEDFVTAINRALFTLLTGRLIEGQGVDVPSLAPHLTEGQLNRLSRILAVGASMSPKPGEAEDYIDRILSFGRQKNKQQVLEMGEDWEAYIKSLGAGKKGR